MNTLKANAVKFALAAAMLTSITACTSMINATGSYTLAQAQAEALEIKGAVDTAVTVAEAAGILKGATALTVNGDVAKLDAAASAFAALPDTTNIATEAAAVTAAITSLESDFSFSTNTVSDINLALNVIDSVINIVVPHLGTAAPGTVAPPVKIRLS